jgi:hypothetical protein
VLDVEIFETNVWETGALLYGVIENKGIPFVTLSTFSGLFTV